LETLDEYKIYQNEVLGAHSIWEFVKYYNNYHSERDFPELILALPVLPIVLNLRSAEEICKRQFKPGSLIRTIIENRDLYTGLQERMESMVGLSLESINMATDLGVLKLDAQSTKLISINRTVPFKKLGIINTDYDKIILSSRRIGAWFGQLSMIEITSYFNINF
jgi:hypothetical protein